MREFVYFHPASGLVYSPKDFKGLEGEKVKLEIYKYNQPNQSKTGTVLEIDIKKNNRPNLELRVEISNCHRTRHIKKQIPYDTILRAWHIREVVPNPQIR